MNKFRVLPHSNESEVALLGSLLVYPEALQIVNESGLSEVDFYHPAHKILITHMKTLIERDNFLSTSVLVDRLNDHKGLKSIGDVEYLITLTENASGVSSLEHYIKNIREKSQARRLIEVSQEIERMGFDGSVDIEQLLDGAEEQVLEITRSRNTSKIRESVDIVNDLMENIKKAMASDGGLTGLSTGFKSLNNVTSGLQKGDLIIVGSRPSMGKTAFALSLALNVARYNDAGVAVFSLEMPDTDLFARMTSSIALVEGNKLRSGYLKEHELQDLHKAGHVLKQLKLFVDDSSSITVPEIFSQCRRLKNDGKLDLVVIDYMQLITGSSEHQGNRQQETSKISRQLKQLAREMEVPVIALSQLSRSLETREDKRPILSDLRESGSIEQDADIVMFLHRDDYFNRDEEEDEIPHQGMRQSPTLLRISKHRNGALADIDLTFMPEISKFYDTE